MPVAPIERNDHAEPNAEAFIFGFDFPADGVIQKIDWTKIKPTAACPPAGWRWLHYSGGGPPPPPTLQALRMVSEAVRSAAPPLHLCASARARARERERERERDEISED